MTRCRCAPYTRSMLRRDIDPRYQAWGPWLLGLALLVSLVVLATLQFRWTGELSRAERERARSSLEKGLERTARGLDRELTALALAFGPEGRPPDLAEERSRAWLGERLDLWRDWSAHPQLLRGVYRVRLGSAYRGRSDATTRPTLERFDDGTIRWVETTWPDALASVRGRLTQAIDSRPGRPGPPGAPGPPHFRLLDSQAPAILLPHMGGGSRRRFFEERSMGPRLFEVEILILWLDGQRLRDGLLTELASEHLADPDGSLPYHLSVVEHESGETLFGLGPALADDSPGDAEASAALFGFVEPESLADFSARLDTARIVARTSRPELAEPDARPGRAPEPGAGADVSETRTERRRDRRSRRGRPGALLAFSGGEKLWRLVATHPAGSLDRAIERSRWRNLGISFAILALLAASAIALLRATRRAQRLARTQSELVAGVTHELMTPLAALRSAGQNLADGVVRDEDGVRRYGRLVDREGRRLSEMVAQMLELAGIAAGNRPFERYPVKVEEWIERSLGDVRAELEQAEIEVEIRLEPDSSGAPLVVEGDVEALGRVLRNLLGNAIKYAAEGRWIGIGARRVGDTIVLDVADRGPGIPPADRPHVFEPFRRGRDMAASTTPGSGLGLALVRSIVLAHGGTVELSDRGGCVVTLRLPAASPSAS